MKKIPENAAVIVSVSVLKADLAPYLYTPEKCYDCGQYIGITYNTLREVKNRQPNDPIIFECVECARKREKEEGRTLLPHLPTLETIKAVSESTGLSVETVMLNVLFSFTERILRRKEEKP